MLRIISASLALFLLSGGDALAQTCAAPEAYIGCSGCAAVTGDTCALQDEVALFCDFLDSAGTNDAIYQLTLPAIGAPTRTWSQISISGSGAGANPVIYLYSGACATGSPCAASGDTGNPLGNSDSIPGGVYFLAVTAAPSDAPGTCFSYTLDNDGSIPVELQSFSIN